MNEDENEIVQEYNKRIRSLKRKYIFFTIVFVILAAVVSSEYTLLQVNNSLKLDKAESSKNSKDNINAIAKTLKNFREEVIDRYYLGEIDEQKIMDETIKGYVNGLGDEYSVYMTAKEWEEFQADALGNYVGIGIYMSSDKNGNVVVVAPIKGTPADEVGLAEGDIIVSVNDESVIGQSTEAVSSLIKGEEGTKVKITIYRDSEYKDFEITRKAIKVYHVDSELLDNNIGLIQLHTFDEGCANEFRKAYLDLKSKGAKKIIIDLRNNTGGLVDEALSILDLIIPKGNTELITVDSKGEKEFTYAKGNSIIDCDIVVLVNQYSASASEIMVGALRDNKKATIVGTTTYGKGVIQSIFMVPEDGSALKLTVNEYYTPNETKINKIGIEPDYVIELDPETDEDEQLNKAIELLK